MNQGRKRGKKCFEDRIRKMSEKYGKLVLKGEKQQIIPSTSFILRKYNLFETIEEPVDKNLINLYK